MINEFDLPKPKPRDSEPMMVIHELAKIVKNEMRKTLEDASIPISYRALLFELARSNGISQLELAKRARLKPPTVSITVRKMEEDGYIKRVPSSTDLRVMHIYLTEKGADIHRINSVKIDNLEKALMKGISEEDKQYVLDILIKMRDNICNELGTDFRKCCHDVED